MDQKTIHNPVPPAAPLLPPNDPGQAAPDNVMAAYYGGKDPFADARHPAEDPQVMQDVANVLSNAVQHVTMDTYTDIVKLPIPITLAGREISEGRVRELTGGDEETLARTAASGEPERVLVSLVQCGVVELGGITPNAGDLMELPVPVRDELMLAIRIVTYGKEVHFERLSCTRCQEEMEIVYDLDDVPRGKASTDQITVPLRRGGHAVLRWPTVADQVEILTAIRTRQINAAEQDTLLLARCLVKLTNSSGQEVTLQGEETARALSLTDRAAMLKALDDRPGPLLDEAKVTCPWCEKETEVPLSIDILFRG